MHLRYTPVPDWPRLAWLARCRRGDPTVEVFHGPDVETTPDWFCEAVWDGEFRRAGFDETDVVFGSGARRHGASITFVSSGSTVDPDETNVMLAPWRSEEHTSELQSRPHLGCRLLPANSKTQ